MKQLMVFVILATASAVAAGAQIPTKPLGDMGSVSGRIFDADTGQLITQELNIDATLDAIVMAPPGSRQMDVAGEFVFSDLQAGLYLLSVREKGNRLPIATRNVKVTAGSAMSRADIYLRLPGKINAVVVDSSGEPVQGATVVLVSSEYFLGHAKYTFATETKTDDRGHANFPDRVVAGHPYFLLALPPDAAKPALSGTPLLEAVWSPGHPGAWQPFVLRSAEQKQIEIVMQRSPTYCVDGRLTGNGLPAASDFEIAIPEVAGYVGLTGGTRGVISKGKSDESGHFHVCGLWKGDFVLAAGLNKDFYGRSTISIVDRDVSNIMLRALSPISLAVDIHWDQVQIPEQALRLQIVPLNRVIFETQPFLTKSMNAIVPSHFTVSLLPFTDYVISGVSLSPGGEFSRNYLELNCDGRISGNTLTLGDAPCKLDITVDTDMGNLAATVLDKDNSPDSNSSVCVFLSSAASAEQIAETGKCSDVQDPKTGSISIVARPGRYVAMVIPPGTFDWVGYISANRALGKSFEITARSTSQLTLKSSTAH